MTDQGAKSIQECGYTLIRSSERVGNDGKRKYVIEQSSIYNVWKDLAILKTRSACIRVLNDLSNEPGIIIIH